MDLGSSATTLNIFSPHGVYFTIALSTGGDRFTSEIQSHCHVNYPAAEYLKKTGQVAKEFPMENSDTVYLQGVLQTSYDTLISEIRQALIYYNKRTGVRNFDRLILNGGGANLPNFANYLSQKMGIQVEIFNPLEKIHIDHRQFKPEELAPWVAHLGLAVGLALRVKEDY